MMPKTKTLHDYAVENAMHRKPRIIVISEISESRGGEDRVPSLFASILRDLPVSGRDFEYCAPIEWVYDNVSDASPSAVQGA